MNLCVLRGVVIGDPRVTDLSSGQRALSFDVQTRSEGRSQASVPVEWTGPPSKMPKIVAGAPVAVVGTVARRFYRSGGSIQTRVYVCPTRIVVKQPKRQARTLVDALAGALDDLNDTDY